MHTDPVTAGDAISGSPRHTPVLVFGASGYIGTNLVPFLVARGHRVRAVSRNPAVLDGRQISHPGQGLEITIDETPEEVLAATELEKEEELQELLHEDILPEKETEN